MKTIQEALEHLSTLSGTAFDKELDKISETYTTAKDLQQVEAFMSERLKNVGKSIAEMKKEVEHLRVKEQLSDISEVVNLSYIARTYFHKSKQWLSQRINENVVGGKPRTLSPDDKQILNRALADLSQKIGSVTVV